MIINVIVKTEMNTTDNVDKLLSLDLSSCESFYEIKIFNQYAPNIHKNLRISTNIHELFMKGYETNVYERKVIEWNYARK